ncbi:putative transcription factor C3H family [Helianthus annuus]|uniref:Putative zinc finger, CCCH-type n=1 Tax=Helianthus annuus TaxID=4232 RepID=A0A251UIP8_HELAN|nr:zinc finger CCCH domain-containing protein 39 [Helianthus annuus]KAF5802847.1 putative transcription factor C3H family [Helianthus annuus]KAJ0560916.1 putative transcription factor C3H family [Helianthus annuus]KAJ0567399.1 putative transcription factor C3H family [Helianthus annuus]KAJ0573957.1 putative transcription factor C3H family [Helianthus annuus]KAJ0738290.1 putative transcription factor C3H family [Helianthus annuus]
MFQHPFNGGNNGEGELFPQQSGSNFQFEATNNRSRNNSEVNMNPTKSTSLRPAGQRSTFSNIPVNRGTTHIFYKTRMCQKFLDGICRNGDGCTFAHGPNDLREPPPNWQELVKDNRGGNAGGNWNWNDDQKIIHRMKICKKFYNGDECPYGERCNFLHESPAKFKAEAGVDGGRTRESSVINIRTVVDRGQSQTEAGQDCITIGKTDQDASRGSVKTSFWKTQICGKWEMTGQCIFAEKCHFAHGLAELQTGRVEGDRHHYGGSVAAHMVSGPITEPLATASATAVPVVRRGVGKGFLKLANKKLNRIYGDWIDDEDDDLS